MKLKLVLLLPLFSLLNPFVAADAPAKAVNPSNPGKEKPSWAFAPDAKLANVLILGDSISIGYTLNVRTMLAGRANVFRPISDNGKSAENCSGTTKGVLAIDRWLSGRKWDVIHFNFGLHDLKHVARSGEETATSNKSDPRQASVERYAKNLETIVGKLQATGARLVFATTTPVAPGTISPLREPEVPPLYNAAAVEVMEKHGIRINDLFAFCSPHLELWQQPKNVHFTAEGSKALAEQVVKVIEEELDAKKLRK